MKALIWHEASLLNFKSAPPPVLFTTRHAILKISVSAFCGTDIHLLAKQRHNQRILNYSKNIGCRACSRLTKADGADVSCSGRSVDRVFPANCRKMYRLQNG